MLLILIISMFSLSALGVDFNVYWHVPSSPCSEMFNINVTHKLLKCNVLVNNGEEFWGDKFVWFYELKFGMFPYIHTVNGEHIYNDGGIPQFDNLTFHLAWAETEIEQLTDPNFDGIGVIDWRQWNPIYDYNLGSKSIYKKLTKELVKENNPSIREEEIESTARIQWEEAAKKWLLETLKLVKRVRPKAKWCYYSFPDCYNHQRGDVPHDFTCRKEIQRHNDRLSWLWKESTALCPSIKLGSREEKYDDSERQWYLYGRLAEARRVASPNTLIYPFVSSFRNPNWESLESFLDMIGAPASMGFDGAVISGSSKYIRDKNDCEELDRYVTAVICPAVTNVYTQFHKCSRTVCTNDGRCTWPYEIFNSMDYMLYDSCRNFNSKAVFCRCEENEGRYCDKYYYNDYY